MQGCGVGNVIPVAHSANLYTQFLGHDSQTLMNSFNVSPGEVVDMKASPIRNPSNPKPLSCKISSGVCMPLSAIFTASA